MHEQYNVILIELKVLYLGIQRAEDQRDQISKELGDIKVQFVDMKIKLKDSMAEISKFGKVLEKVEDLVKKNNMEVAGINANSRKLFELVQYTSSPCTNCKGPTFCLDGQVVQNTPKQGTKIRAPKNTEYKAYGRQVKVLAGDIGVVDGSSRVTWKHAGALYWRDLPGFVYNCK